MYRHPISRTAVAGNPAFRSEVTVNIALAISSGSRLFSFIIVSINSLVAAAISAASFRSTVIAPRIPLKTLHPMLPSSSTL
jgi:hypothetical protein